MLRDIWTLASRPKAFFGALAEQNSNLPRSLMAAVLSMGIGTAIFLLAFTRMTASNAYAPIFALGIPAGLFLWLILWFIGGLIIIRPSGLDTRAWELTAWAWTVAGLVALSLLLVAIYLPFIAILLGLLAATIWHLLLLNTALKSFGSKNIFQTLLAYAFSVFVLPWLMFIVFYLIVNR